MYMQIYIYTLLQHFLVYWKCCTPHYLGSGSGRISHVMSGNIRLQSVSKKWHPVHPYDSPADSCRKWCDIFCAIWLTLIPTDAAKVRLGSWHFCWFICLCAEYLLRHSFSLCVVTDSIWTCAGFRCLLTATQFAMLKCGQLVLAYISGMCNF